MAKRGRPPKNKALLNNLGDVAEVEEEAPMDETTAKVDKAQDTGALDFLKNTAKKMTKETLESWLKLGETVGPTLQKRSRAMGYDDPAEYLKSAMDFFDAYRDRVMEMEEKIVLLRGELSLLAHLKPNIIKAWAIKEYKKLRNLYLLGHISEEAYKTSLDAINTIVKGDIYAKEG